MAPDGDRWAKRSISGGPGAGGMVKVAVRAAVRYVAIALRNANYLSLAEVEVWGKGGSVAVGTALRRKGAGRPPHGSQRAELPHWAPTLGLPCASLPSST
jgi:hypothetical protein